MGQTQPRNDAGKAEVEYWKKFRILTINNEDHHLRPGQIAFNALPDGEGAGIVGTIYDCFENDRNMPRFYEWLFDWFDRKQKEEKLVKIVTN